ncbi:MAG: type II 3-dehydroquinate dehydratase [Candidatus Paraimprobicoccus trichonymphae]|uniref:3-dehydroquinate dehydratase n=1 Tax=Candidatus Paraimprobicoccus trichonymphae TaxID=3033793 RepID=A0AA48KZV1_9FIRM|nr:MAG: type II 3-dehydroquinate dehydratase [Candidatus Paraimprobicoccus trichonymphae]
MNRKNIFVLLGPNLNMVGVREKSIYGEESAEKIKSQIIEYADRLNFNCEVFHSNHEGELVDKIHEIRENIFGGIINIGPLSGYSYCLRDAIYLTRIPFVEVHTSNVYTRENFRSKSVIAGVCIGQISGFGKHSYFLAIEALKYLV